MVGKRSLTNPRDPKNNVERDGDIETGFEQRKPTRFKDAVHTIMSDRTTADLKRQLQSGINQEEFERYRKSEDDIKAIKNKKIRQYYEKQNDRLNDWLEVDTLVQAMGDQIFDSMNPDANHDGIRERYGGLQHVQEHIEALLPADERERRAKAARTARWAININVIANILLLIAKGIAATQSSSLSLIASLVDSGLDLLCTGIMWSTNRLVSLRLGAIQRRFPVGRRRLEPIGILVFSVIMIISFLQILQESVTKLLPSGDHSIAALPAVAIGAMASTVVIKGIVGLGCMRIRTTQVRALAQDCKTDVIFNTFSLLFPLISKSANICSAVDDQLQKKLNFLAYRFSPLVKSFKTITAYHAGDGVWLKFDIIMDEKAPLRRVHDISETLQYCAEGLDEVDRSFVTADYAAENPEGHAKWRKGLQHTETGQRSQSSEQAGAGGG